MLKQDYQAWMDQVEPGRDFRARLTEAMAARPVRRPRRIGRTVLAAAAVCGTLVVSALALSPDLRQTLSGILGGYTPYSQTVEGVSVTDQGVKVEVVAALTDAAGGTAYLEVTDLEGDRIGADTTLAGGEEPLAYDSESGTALYAWELDREGLWEDGTVEVSLSEFWPGQVRQSGIELPWEEFTSFETLVSTAVTGEDGTTLTTLAPEQTHMALDGTDDVWISSVGYDRDGHFHIQFGLSEAVTHLEEAEILPADLTDMEQFHYVVLEGGRYIDWYWKESRDLALEELPEMISASYWTGTAIQGDWTLRFEPEMLPHRTVALSQSQEGLRLEQVELTAMSLSLRVGFEHPELGVDGEAYLGTRSMLLQLKNGEQVALAFDQRYQVFQSEDGSLHTILDQSSPGGERYGALYVWILPEAIEPDLVEGLWLGEMYLPLREA